MHKGDTTKGGAISVSVYDRKGRSFPSGYSQYITVQRLPLRLALKACRRQGVSPVLVRRWNYHKASRTRFSSIFEWKLQNLKDVKNTLPLKGVSILYLDLQSKPVWPKSVPAAFRVCWDKRWFISWWRAIYLLLKIFTNYVENRKMK